MRVPATRVIAISVLLWLQDNTKSYKKTEAATIIIRPKKLIAVSFSNAVLVSIYMRCSLLVTPNPKYCFLVLEKPISDIVVQSI